MIHLLMGSGKGRDINIPISRIPVNVRYKSCSGDFRQSNLIYTVSIDVIDAISLVYSLQNS